VEGGDYYGENMKRDRKGYHHAQKAADANVVSSSKFLPLFYQHITSNLRLLSRL
jgi:hypothetical protein